MSYDVSRRPRCLRGLLIGSALVSGGCTTAHIPAPVLSERNSAFEVVLRSLADSMPQGTQLLVEPRPIRSGVVDPVADDLAAADDSVLARRLAIIKKIGVRDTNAFLPSGRCAHVMSIPAAGSFADCPRAPMWIVAMSEPARAPNDAGGSSVYSISLLLRALSPNGQASENRRYLLRKTGANWQTAGWRVVDEIVR
jgi:hypothetical protein